MASSSNTHPAPTIPRKYRLGGPRAWWIWILVTIFTVYLFNVQTMFSVVQGDIRTTLGLTQQQLTFIAGAYTWAFAIFQFFGGAFLDCFGSRKVLIPAFIFVTAGVFLYGLATTYPMVIAAQILMALGACCGFVGAGYIGGIWFGMAAYGTMFGYVQTISSLSSAIQQPITNAVLSHMTYRDLFVYLGIFGVALVVLCIIYMRNPTPVAVKGNPFKTVGSDLLQIIKKPQMWIAAMWGGIAFGLNLALGVVWCPQIFIDHGFTAGNGNVGSALLWLGLAVGSMFWPQWSNRIHSRRIPSIIGIVMMLVGLAAVVFIQMPVWAMVVMMFIIGLGATSHMLAFVVGEDIASGPLVGTSSAFMNGIMFIFGGILQNIPSALADKGPTAMFVPFIVACGIALLFVLIQKETAPRK